MASVYCLDCDCRIDLNVEVKEGLRITCPECEANLEVLSLDPLELDWSYDGPMIDEPFSEPWTEQVIGQSNLQKYSRHREW